MYRLGYYLRYGINWLKRWWRLRGLELSEDVPTYEEWVNILENIRQDLLPDIRDISLRSLRSRDDYIYTIFRPSARWIDCAVTKSEAKKFAGAHLCSNQYDEPRKVGETVHIATGMLDHHGNLVVMSYSLTLVGKVKTPYRWDRKYEVWNFQFKEVTMAEMLTTAIGSLDHLEDVLSALDNVYRRTIRQKEERLEALKARRRSVTVAAAQEVSDRGVMFNQLDIRGELIAPLW